MDDDGADAREIRALIAGQFESLSWGPGRDGDWPRFEAGFLEFARMFPAQRPAAPRTPREFVDRLKTLRDTGNLAEFHETGVGVAVFVVGKVAVALAGCEMLENGGKTTRDVSVFLLVKNSEGWRIAAQAWDYVDDIATAFAAVGLANACE